MGSCDGFLASRTRLPDSYCFLINILNAASSPLFGRRGSPGPRPGTVDDPLHHKEVFLQRAENREQFSKSSVSDHQFDFYLNIGMGIETAYLVVLPKTDRAGEPIVRSLADKIELQFTLSGKKVILEYKIKDLVKSLEEL